MEVSLSTKSPFRWMDLGFEWCMSTEMAIGWMDLGFEWCMSTGMAIWWTEAGGEMNMSTKMGVLVDMLYVEPKDGQRLLDMFGTGV